jgi:hypothetical protein
MRGRGSEEGQVVGGVTVMIGEEKGRMNLQNGRDRELSLLKKETRCFLEGEVGVPIVAQSRCCDGEGEGEESEGDGVWDANRGLRNPWCFEDRDKRGRV